MFGYSLEEMKKQSIQSLVHPDDVEMVMKYHRGRISGKNVPSKYEFMGVRKDGSIIYLEVHTDALTMGRKIVGTRSYLWDITERKQVEKDNQQSMAALRKLGV
jgi:PAS domain S-box-containing protein